MHEPAAGEIVVGDGNLQFAFRIAQGHHFLHRAFSEATVADGNRPVIVHQTAGYNLRCAGRVFVDQHDHWEIGKRALTIGAINRLGPITSLRPDDHAVLHEHIDHFLGLFELPAGVKAKIENEAAHALPDELVEHAFDLL